MKNEKHNVLLFGQGTYLNKGCEAIVTTTAESIKHVDKVNSITVATFDIENDKSFHKDLINKYVAHRWDHEVSEEERIKTRNALNKEIGQNDICMSIGGDNYCYHGSSWLYTIDQEVKKRYKKLVLWGASVNEDAIDNDFVRDIRSFDLVIVRESLTYDLLSKYVEADRLMLKPDPAFSLEPKKCALPKGFQGKEGVVGMNISPYALNGHGRDDAALSSICKLIDHILESHPYKIALIPHVYKSKSNDLNILRDIKKQYSDNDRVFVADKKIYDCGELKYIISKCKFFIASRTHASIAGYSTGVPTLVLGYSIKSKGIAQDIFGDYSDYVLPVQDLVDSTMLIDKFEYLIKHERQIKAVLAKKMPIYKKEAGSLFKTAMKRLEDLDNKHVTPRGKCSGCTACKNSCTKSAIKMTEDEEGFPYPAIDQTKCIDCGVCRQVCPNNKSYAYKYKDLKAYACKNKDDQERVSSSSGGVFSLLAKSTLAKGGSVYGAAYSNYGVKHIRIDDEKDLKKLMGSKYVESSIGDSYQNVKKDLKAGKEVLFSGVSCQIEGLKSFLGRDYPNLLCVAVVCHGVPSKKVFREHLKSMEKKYDDKLIDINFRNKDKGWADFQTEYIFDKKTVKAKKREGKYMLGFLENYYLRQSCYVCDFRLYKKNTADIVLSDFWGIQSEVKDFDDDKGVSAVILNSKKGLEIFNSIKNKLVLSKVDIEQVAKHNSPLIKPVEINLGRFDFFHLYNKTGLGYTIDYFQRKKEALKLSDDLKKAEKQIIQEKERADKAQTENSKILNSKRWIFSSKMATVFNGAFPQGSLRRKTIGKVSRKTLAKRRGK